MRAPGCRLKRRGGNDPEESCLRALLPMLFLNLCLDRLPLHCIPDRDGSLLRPDQSAVWKCDAIHASRDDVTLLHIDTSCLFFRDSQMSLHRRRRSALDRLTLQYYFALLFGTMIMKPFSRSFPTLSVPCRFLLSFIRIGHSTGMLSSSCSFSAFAFSSFTASRAASSSSASSLS